ncbi:MAG: PEP-CTERM sorting domain-containing protein [Alphaproteobacteria bacterium]|uniref:PEP-CTERM sorting domain-containing protein n=1 Tax=Candidatus Nitrobium versatile TaxID=2884831 RepID=A0A953SEA6_9BACT|nr:PEP-CTERM sorting domain-containing protein [Candidatus Nitrobium versatile]
MKRYILWLLLALIVGPLLMAPEAGAYPFVEVEGYVGIGAAPVSNGDGTSTFNDIDYGFTVLGADPGVEMDRVNLRFDSQVFSSVGSITGVKTVINGVISYDDWEAYFATGPSGSKYAVIESGTPLEEGDSVEISLSGLTANDQALSSPSLWSGGSVWGQVWSARDTEYGMDGGVTTLQVPEPGILLLFVFGTITMLLYTRHRKSA